MVQAVLSAAIEVFGERGYAGLTIDEIATRAGVNKTTVYRRWPTKADLVGAALISMKQSTELPNSGNVRLDLFLLLRQKADALVTPRGRSVRRAVFAGTAEPELKAVILALRKEHPLVPRELLERAVEKGELPVGTDLKLVTDALAGAVLSATMWSDRVEDEFLRQLIDLVISGAAAVARAARG